MASNMLIQPNQSNVERRLTVPPQEVEWGNADQAVLEFRATGETTRRCLRCGGNFKFFDAGSAFRIRCEREGCFDETVRGI